MYGQVPVIYRLLAYQPLHTLFCAGGGLVANLELIIPLGI